MRKRLQMKAIGPKAYKMMISKTIYGFVEAKAHPRYIDTGYMKLQSINRETRFTHYADI